MLKWWLSDPSNNYTSAGIQNEILNHDPLHCWQSHSEVVHTSVLQFITTDGIQNVLAVEQGAKCICSVDHYPAPQGKNPLFSFACNALWRVHALLPTPIDVNMFLSAAHLQAGRSLQARHAAQRIHLRWRWGVYYFSSHTEKTAFPGVCRNLLCLPCRWQNYKELNNRNFCSLSLSLFFLFYFLFVLLGSLHFTVSPPLQIIVSWI